TTSGGLYRYNIHDVVRCVGYRSQAPLLEFLNKGKNFSSLTGEKLSEHQVVHAVEKSFAQLGIQAERFTVAPVINTGPGYVLLLESGQNCGRETELAGRVQANLAILNEEYAAKCASGRLGRIAVQHVPAGTWQRLRAEKTDERGNFEEYKHTYLTQDP